MNIIKLTRVLVLFFIALNPLYSQSKVVWATADKCGFDPMHAARTFDALGHAWGYGYDTLQIDLQKWTQSPFAQIDSIGASTLNRALWMLTITDSTAAIVPRIRISIHARTHPGEVQSTWVTNELINQLLGDSGLARLLRRNCIFNILPMYNPDGVELGFARGNANGIDIESNWYAAQSEQEVLMLRQFFKGKMNTANPIEIALNMHSAYACKRYFVFHDAAGTSTEYEELERDFVDKIHNQWPEEIEPWSYMITWTNGTPLRYPESWFWLNHGAAVMALTYEDKNCDTAADFDRVANALLTGIGEYLGLQSEPTSVTENRSISAANTVVRLYPNPVAAGGIFQVAISSNKEMDAMYLFDILGRRVGSFMRPGREAAFRLPNLPAGKYFLTTIFKNSRVVTPITILQN